MVIKTLLTTLGSSLGSLAVTAKMPPNSEVRAHRSAQVQKLNALARKRGEQQLKDGIHEEAIGQNMLWQDMHKEPKQHPSYKQAPYAKEFDRQMSP